MADETYEYADDDYSTDDDFDEADRLDDDLDDCRDWYCEDCGRELVTDYDTPYCPWCDGGESDGV
jgi:rubrerythrin